MLWSLSKIVLFMAAVAALALGAGFLMETSGGVQVTVMATEYNFGPLQSVIAVLALIVAVWVLLKLLSLMVAVFRFLNGDETALSRYFDRNRERKGYEALFQGMNALASGDGSVAIAKAERAQRLLDKPELTNLLTAQAAELSGDRRKAEDTYKKMLTHESTRFVGVRGILKQKLADGDTDTALQLAQKAFAIKPKHEETQDVLLKLQAQTANWSGARETLNTKLKTGTIPRDVHRRRDAVLALSKAQEELADGNLTASRDSAMAANRLSPGLVPAAVMAAQANIELKQPKNATKIIKKAWQLSPHPDLAAVFADIVPDETPDARLKRFSVLTRMNPEHSETKMLLAELNIAAEDFPEARRAVTALVESEPTTRSATIMAAIERGEGASEPIINGWLAKAITVPRGPQWICENCHHVQAEWTAVCENCQSFDTLLWINSPEPEIATSSGTQMLPLVIGSPSVPHLT